MEDPLKVLFDALVVWVEEKEKNGIAQHSKEWELIKRFSVGGSSMAVLMGINPFSKIYDLIAQRVGLSFFQSNIKPQWGNLFEDVIKRCVEYEHDCIILGEDLFIEGKPGVTYSPDGLAAMNVTLEEMVEIDTIVDTPTGKKTITELGTQPVKSTQTVLLEFKCPYSRIPKGSTPAYYVPQVKMGLEVLDIATVGLYAEAVYRRCTWEQLGYNPDYDKTLVKVSSGKMPKSYGVLGYYIDHKAFDAYLDKLRASPYKITPEELIDIRDNFLAAYEEAFVEAGDATNDFISNDMGGSDPKLFEMLMDAYDKKIITPWYGKIVICEKEKPVSCIDINGYGHIHNGYDTVNSDVAAFSAFCRENNFTNIGILPWKMFRIDYHYIERSPGYIDPWMPKITEIVECVKKCLELPDMKDRILLINEFLEKDHNEAIAKGTRRATTKKKQLYCGFSDDM